MEKTIVSVEQIRKKRGWHFQLFSKESREAENILSNSQYPLVQLSELVEKTARGFPQIGSQQLSGSGIPLLSVRNIKSDLVVIDDNTKFISPQEHEKLKNSAIQHGDVLVSLFVRENDNLTTVYNMNEPANLSSHLVLLRLKKDRINPQYLTAFLNSSIGKNLIFRVSTGNIQRALTISQLLELSIPLPSLAEQNELVEKIIEKREQAAKREKEATLLREEASQQIEDFVRGEE